MLVNFNSNIKLISKYRSIYNIYVNSRLESKDSFKNLAVYLDSPIRYVIYSRINLGNIILIGGSND